MKRFHRVIALNLIIIYWLKIGPIEGIVGGQRATVNQFKYQLSLRSNGYHTCGAAIIGEQHALTAAHCVMNEKDEFEINNQFSVIGGAIDFVINYPSKIEVGVEAIYVPREFKCSSTQNNVLNYRSTGDIAVLKLMTELKLNQRPWLRKLELPTLNDINKNFEHEKAVIAGFGKDIVIVHRDNIHGRRIEEQWSNGRIKLQFTESIVLSNRRCNFMYHNPLQDSHLCSQAVQIDDENPTGVCSGDSGSPLVVNKNTVIGLLVSGSDDCNEKYEAAIYTKIQSFISFIQKALHDEQSPDIRVAAYRKKKTLLGCFRGDFEFAEITSSTQIGESLHKVESSKSYE